MTKAKGEKPPESTRDRENLIAKALARKELSESDRAKMAKKRAVGLPITARGKRPKKKKAYDQSIVFQRAAFVDEWEMGELQANNISALLGSDQYRADVEAAIRHARFLESVESTRPSRLEFHLLIEKLVETAQDLAAVLDSVEHRDDVRQELPLTRRGLETHREDLLHLAEQGASALIRWPRKGDWAFAASDSLVDSLAAIWQRAHGQPPVAPKKRREDYYFGLFQDFVEAVAIPARINVKASRVKGFLKKIAARTT